MAPVVTDPMSLFCHSMSHVYVCCADNGFFTFVVMVHVGVSFHSAGCIVDHHLMLFCRPSAFNRHLKCMYLHYLEWLVISAVEMTENIPCMNIQHPVVRCSYKYAGVRCFGRNVQRMGVTCFGRKVLRMGVRCFDMNVQQMGVG